MCTQIGQFMKITNVKGIFNSNVWITKQKLSNHVNKHRQVFLHVILIYPNLTQDNSEESQERATDAWSPEADWGSPVGHQHSLSISVENDYGG